jgi:hypothetical protein
MIKIRINNYFSSYYKKIQSAPFGQAQQPQLADYADGIDTMAFLSTL